MWHLEFPEMQEEVVVVALFQKNVGNPNHHYFSKKYRNTPPICIAIRLPFVSQYFRFEGSYLCARKTAKTCATCPKEVLKLFRQEEGTQTESLPPIELGETALAEAARCMEKLQSDDDIEAWLRRGDHSTMSKDFGSKKAWEWQCSSERLREQFQTILGHRI